MLETKQNGFKAVSQDAVCLRMPLKMKMRH